ncbi:MAG: hypothetical protein ACRDRW_12420 [Pseudonocardiaceae bacterium]
MYSYDILSEAREQVDGLPLGALPFYAELITFLELTPWDGPPYREDKRDGNMRKILFGRGAKGIAVYLVLEQERRVVVLSVTWVD